MADTMSRNANSTAPIERVLACLPDAKETAGGWQAGKRCG